MKITFPNGSQFFSIESHETYGQKYKRGAYCIEGDGCFAERTDDVPDDWPHKVGNETADEVNISCSWLVKSVQKGHQKTRQKYRSRWDPRAIDSVSWRYNRHLKFKRTVECIQKKYLRILLVFDDRQDKAYDLQAKEKNIGEYCHF